MLKNFEHERYKIFLCGILMNLMFNKADKILFRIIMNPDPAGCIHDRPTRLDIERMGTGTSISAMGQFIDNKWHGLNGNAFSFYPDANHGNGFSFHVGNIGQFFGATNIVNVKLIIKGVLRKGVRYQNNP